VPRCQHVTRAPFVPPGPLTPSQALCFSRLLHVPPRRIWWRQVGQVRLFSHPLRSEFIDDFVSRYIEFMDASDIVLLIGDIVAIVVIAFVILSSPIRYFIRKRRCCLSVSCCGQQEPQPEEEVVRRPESVIKCGHRVRLSLCWIL
jgi:hypothetical protein